MKITSSLVATASLCAFVCAPATTPAEEGRNSASRPESAEHSLRQSDTEAHVRYLASDELGGRQPGTDGGMAAARYIAEHFRKAGLVSLPGAEDFFQQVPLIRRRPVLDGYVVALGDTLRMQSDGILIAGQATNVAATGVYVNYGTAADFDALEVSLDGRVALARLGSPDAYSITAAMRIAETKRALVASMGAVGLVELVGSEDSWDRIYRYATPERHLQDVGAPELPHVWIADPDDGIRNEATRRNLRITVSAPESPRSHFSSPNVIGLVPGTDPALRDEYVLLLGHYDHLGSGPAAEFAGRLPSSPESDDHVYNGARDNAIGIAALLNAASALGAMPPARSVLIAAVTAEESGLIGSTYYARYPAVPISKTVFVQNVDGAGYNDTGIVTVVGRGRTSADGDIDAGASAFDLQAISDPVPEQRLYERSDHIVFARLGIPSVAFSPGFRSLDEDLMRFYHRVEDEADEDLDFAYVHRFTQSFAHAARRIADSPDRPAWTVGDEFEMAVRRRHEPESHDN